MAIPTVALYVPKFGRVVTVNAADEAQWRAEFGATAPDEPRTEAKADEEEGREEEAVLTPAEAEAKPKKVTKKATPTE